MSANSGRARVQGALKDLHIHWNKAQESWNDHVSHEFQRNHVDTLEPKVRAAVLAIERMREVLDRLRRECGD